MHWLLLLFFILNKVMLVEFNRNICIIYWHSQLVSSIIFWFSDNVPTPSIIFSKGIIYGKGRPVEILIHVNMKRIINDSSNLGLLLPVFCHLLFPNLSRNGVVFSLRHVSCDEILLLFGVD